jgi:hypothetical protein
MKDTLVFENFNSTLVFSGLDMANHENLKTLQAMAKAFPREPTSGEQRLLHIAINGDLRPHVTSLLLRYKALQSVCFREGNKKSSYCCSIVQNFIKDLKQASEKRGSEARIAHLECLEDWEFDGKFAVI